MLTANDARIITKAQDARIPEIVDRICCRISTDANEGNYSTIVSSDNIADLLHISREFVVRNKSGIVDNLVKRGFSVSGKFRSQPESAIESIEFIISWEDKK